VRPFGQRVQPVAFLEQQDRGRLARDAMLARVDALPERAAGVLELREGRIIRAQVVIGRDQIGLRDPNGRL